MKDIHIMVINIFGVNMNKQNFEEKKISSILFDFKFEV